MENRIMLKNFDKIFEGVVAVFDLKYFFKMGWRG
jgi:hypothetical protein